jgi:hypothetical protein
VTLKYSARTLRPLVGTVRFCNQGTVFVDTDGDGSNETQVLTTDPTPAEGAPSTNEAVMTCVDVQGRPDRGVPLSLTGVQALWMSDKLRFAALGAGIKAIDVQIFSLSGKPVHASGWVENGHEWRMQNSKGKEIANGVYLYVVTVRGDNGDVQTKVGKLLIHR